MLNKKVIGFIMCVMVGFAVVGCSSDESITVEDRDNIKVEGTKDIEAEDDIKIEENIPIEHKSALKKAQMYSDTMSMSKVGLYEQLTSEYGEKFTEEAAQYAIDNIEADWNENALKKAKTYQETMSMSSSAIYDQLISEYGEKFTEGEAQYAIDNLD